MQTNLSYYVGGNTRYVLLDLNATSPDKARPVAVPGAAGRTSNIEETRVRKITGLCKCRKVCLDNLLSFKAMVFNT